MFFFEGIFDGLLGGFEFVVGLFEPAGGEFFELFVAAGIDVFEAGFLNFDTDAAHLETVGERGKYLERFEGDFFLFFGRESAERAKVVETVGNFDNKDANVLAGSDE